MCDVVIAPVEKCAGKTFEFGYPHLTRDQIKGFIEKVALFCDMFSSNFKNIFLTNHLFTYKFHKHL